MKVEVPFHFSAGHLYQKSDWSEQKNLDAFGKCVRPHGHDYKGYVTISGELSLVQKQIPLLQLCLAIILKEWDHHFLDSNHADFTTTLPTTEGIALVLHRQIKMLNSDLKIYSITVNEGFELSSTLYFKEDTL